MTITTQNNNSHWLAFFTIANLLIASFISIRFYQVHQLPETFLGQSFAAFHTIGHIGFLCLIMASPLYLIVKLNRNVQWAKALAIMLACLGLSTLLADTFIYQQYRFHINLMVLEMFFFGGSEVIAFPLVMWIKITAVFIGVFSAQWILIRFIKNFTLNVSIIKNLLWAIPGCLILANLVHIWADATYYKDITSQSRYLPLAQPATAKKLMAKFGLLNSEAYKQQSLLKPNKHSTELSYPLTNIESSPIVQPLNVVFIIIDSWRADMMNDKVTPNIAKFARQSSQFTNHYSGSNNTRHGMFSLFYGMPGAYWEPMLQQQSSPVLIDTFLKQGYDGQIYSSAKLTMPEFDQTLFVSIDNLRTHSHGKTPWQRDMNVVQDFNNQYSTNSPTLNVLFFDAAHGFSVPDNYHLPFTPSLKSANFLALSDNYEAKPFLNLYKNSLHFIDQQIGKVLTTISNDLHSTVVIITGDHGKEFNESKKGYWGHNSNYSEHQTKVPLIIHWPNKEKLKINNLTSHMDIVPTIMQELLMVNNPSTDYSSGDSLFSQEFSRESILMGRKGYYAIKDKKHLYELDRFGNFSILDHNYQEQPEAALNMEEINKGLNEMSRFYKKRE